MRLKSLALGALSVGLIYFGSVAAQAQDRAAGTNDSDVRRGDKPKKENRPPKNQTKTDSDITTVLIFPPDTPSPAGMADQLTDTVTRVIQRRLDATKKYHCLIFRRSMPSVRRALIEGTITNLDTDKPFNPAKVKRISQLTGYPVVFTTDINGYSYDADKHQVTVSISLGLIDYTGSKPLVRSAGEQMVSSDKESKSAKELTLALDVSRDLTEKLMTELFKPKPMTKPAPDVETPDKDAAPDKDKSDTTK